jgi:hypothetical protein
MLSYFLVQHKYVELFELSNDEWNKAISENPFLLNNQSFINYDSRSSNAFIEPGKDCYFNNESIVEQFHRLNIKSYFLFNLQNHYLIHTFLFEKYINMLKFHRLFILLQYKTIFKNHKIIIIVDNARTHTAKKYDINLISKRPGRSLLLFNVRYFNRHICLVDKLFLKRLLPGTN